MKKSLYAELKRIGIDEELAVQVSASLDPEHNASKMDVLIMQEAILQAQARFDERYHEQNRILDERYHEHNNKLDERYHELNNKIEQRYHEVNRKSDAVYHELNNKIDQVNHDLNGKIESLKSEMHQGFASLRMEMASMNRQFLITFGGLICTIVAVFLVNLYFHHYM